MNEVSKFFTGESVEMMRSQVVFADYNPRKATEEEIKAIKRGIKKFGMLGGFVVNKRTGNTLVQGHQRMGVLDSLEKFNPETGENDYRIRCELIDVDIKTEKAINLLLNNVNVQGEWDEQKLQKILTEVDYKDAGFSDADLSLLGMDYLFQSEEEENLADSLNELMQGVEEEKQVEREARRMESQAEREAKIQHVKDIKAKVADMAQQSADNTDAYFMVSFNSVKAKDMFLSRLGYPSGLRFIKGEDLDDKIEIIG